MKLFLSTTLVLFCLFAHAQVAINTDGTNAHASAVLDLKSTTKGILIPRVTTAQRTAIASPAHGLMVFDTDYEGFFFFLGGGGGWKQIHNSEDGALLKLPFNGQANAGIRLFTLNNLGNGGVASFTVNNPNDTFTVTDLIQKGQGVALNAQVTNIASTSSVASLTHKGIGSGLQIAVNNASNGARGIDVYHAGVGPAIFATSQGGNGVWGITSSISAAGVIGDNTLGEAVVGRSWGGEGVGAVVGRNSSTGYGVRGFNTDDGIGVLGQAGIGGGQSIAGRFENVNGANTSTALEAETNGSGWAATLKNTNSTTSNGLYISTTSGKGGNALHIANGNLSLSWQDPYTSNAVIDNPYLIIRSAGIVALRITGIPPGTTVWVINFSGGSVTIPNTSIGNVNVTEGKATQFLYLNGPTWIPVQ